MRIKFIILLTIQQKRKRYRINKLKPLSIFQVIGNMESADKLTLQRRS